MNIKKLTSIILSAGLSVLSIVSCTKGTDTQINEEIKKYVSPATFIPVEEALTKMNALIEELDSESAETKSAPARTIKDIKTHYTSKEALTKGETDSIPDAYIVNFENNGGYAVLGAWSNQAPVIALTENGNLDGNFTPVGYIDVTEEEGFDWDNFDWWSDDGDFYTVSPGKAFIQSIILAGVNNETPVDTIADPFGPDTTSFPAGISVPKMLNFKWNQGMPFNDYCYAHVSGNNNNLGTAPTGCSTTALAMIMAYCHRPATLVVDGVTVDYDSLDSLVTGYFGNAVQKEAAARLCGMIFNSCAHKNFPFTTKGHTMITAKTIQSYMQTLGFTNVVRLTGSSFTSTMRSKTIQMLIHGKPVFVSAFDHLYFNNAHSWVIDGYKTQSGTLLLHCNWGLSGNSNGYFASNCIETNSGVEYDSSNQSTSGRGYKFNWHFRVITYNLPSASSAYYGTVGNN